MAETCVVCGLIVVAADDTLTPETHCARPFGGIGHCYHLGYERVTAERERLAEELGSVQDIALAAQAERDEARERVKVVEGALRAARSELENHDNCTANHGTYEALKEIDAALAKLEQP